MGECFLNRIIKTGGGGTDTSDATAEANDVRTGETFYSTAGTKLTGTIANYTPAGTITSNQTLSTANKYCTSDIVIDVASSAELVDVICGSFKDIDHSLYIERIYIEGRIDFRFTTPATKTFKAVVGDTIQFYCADGYAIVYENNVLVGSVVTANFDYPILFPITITMSGSGPLTAYITHSSTIPSVSLYLNRDYGSTTFSFYYNTTNDSVDYTDGSWSELTDNIGLLNINQIKLCAINTGNMGHARIGTTFKGTELGSSSEIPVYTSIQTITNQKNFFLYCEED